jgi:hypothetical protein
MAEQMAVGSFRGATRTRRRGGGLFVTAGVKRWQERVRARAFYDLNSRALREIGVSPEAARCGMLIPNPSNQ